MTPPEVLAYRRAGAPANSPGWRLRVVPNKYPALEANGAWKKGDGRLYRQQSGLGTHEVIIEAPVHVTKITALSEKQYADVIQVYRERALELREDQRWRYVLIYKNQGATAGATFEHVHSQLTAFPLVPREALEEMNGARVYYASKRRCIYCDIIRQDIKEGSRIVSNDERFVVLCPFASRFPYETWILPKQHGSSFEQGPQQESLELGRCLRNTLLRLDRALENPPFNYFIHSNPLGEMENNFYHWHIEILPKRVQVAGFEWGSGFHINPVPPEDAARLLRETLL